MEKQKADEKAKAAQVSPEKALEAATRAVRAKGNRLQEKEGKLERIKKEAEEARKKLFEAQHDVHVARAELDQAKADQASLSIRAAQTEDYDPTELLDRLAEVLQAFGSKAAIEGCHSSISYLRKQCQQCQEAKLQAAAVEVRIHGEDSDSEVSAMDGEEATHVPESVPGERQRGRTLRTEEGPSGKGGRESGSRSRSAARRAATAREGA